MKSLHTLYIGNFSIQNSQESRDDEERCGDKVDRDGLLEEVFADTIDDVADENFLLCNFALVALNENVSDVLCKASNYLIFPNIYSTLGCMSSVCGTSD